MFPRVQLAAAGPANAPEECNESCYSTASEVKLKEEINHGLCLTFEISHGPSRAVDHSDWFVRLRFIA